MKHVRIRNSQKSVEFDCDHCGSPLGESRKPPSRCAVCGKDLCRLCKRHLALQLGGGRLEVVTETTHLCPEHFGMLLEKLHQVVPELCPAAYLLK